jgi:hypothetical protein
MPTHTLTQLQYSKDREGPFALYIYEPDSEYHRGAQWFAKKVRYPDEEITIQKAHELYEKVFTTGREIRITDGGDMLVHHAKNGRVLYGEMFWKDLGVPC